jgi:hypothetical protein
MGVKFDLTLSEEDRLGLLQQRAEQNIQAEER